MKDVLELSREKQEYLKKEFRRKALKKRDREKGPEMDRLISRRFLNHPVYKKAQSLMITSSIGSEVDTGKIIPQAIKDGKTVYLPVTEPKTHRLIPVPVTSYPDGMKIGNYNIPEPPVPEKYNPPAPDEIDLVVVPGLAFGRDGSRIGYGGGYYDRFLEQYRHRTAGLVHESLLMDDIPMQAHDKRVDLIFTENRVIDTLDQIS